MKTKLYVIPNFSSFKRNRYEEGSYILALPQYYTERNKTLWSHFCSDSEFAMSDLQYPNRKDFLNEIFGEGKWEFKFYEFTDLNTFKKDMFESKNEKIDLDKIEDLFKHYKEIDKHL